MSTFSLYCSSYNSGAINSGVPIQLCACVCDNCVERPRSPSLTSPEFPLMKTLSHLRSRWMMLFPCRYSSALKICLAHLRMVFRFTVFCCTNCFSVPDVISSVMNTTELVDSSSQCAKH
jgi:hypothetical protein